MAKTEYKSDFSAAKSHFFLYWPKFWVTRKRAILTDSPFLKEFNPIINKNGTTEQLITYMERKHYCASEQTIGTHATGYAYRRGYRRGDWNYELNYQLPSLLFSRGTHKIDFF